MHNRTYLIPAFLITLFLSFIAILPAAAQDQITVPLSKPGEPGQLELGVVRGTINVTGYNGDEVVIRYSGGNTRQKSKSVTPEGLRRISGSGIGFEVEEKNNVVEVGGISPMHDITFNISVPQNFSLKLSNVHGGGISVENISGEMEISNVNGEVTLTNVGGSAVVNTVNGEIRATFSRVNPDKPMAFSNLNGDIDVTLPANAKITAKMKSEWGEIFTDFEMDIDRSERNKVSQSSGSGTFQVSINNWIYGTINGGGPEYLFKSMRGDIYIRKE